jgi:peptide/nickel transport system permease protein
MLNTGVRRLVITIIRRLGMAALTLLLVSAVVFSAVNWLPGDFATAILGQSATPATIAALRENLGLNEAASIRYLHWVSHAVTGDMGVSLSSIGQADPVTVWQLIRPRLVNTLFLAFFAAIVAVPLAVGLGVATVLARKSPLDKSINVIALTLISIPEFLVGYLFILAFSTWWKLFPSLADVRPDTGLMERIEMCALPIMTLASVTIAHMMRMTRAAILSVLASPYIEAAHLKGLSNTRIVWKHALPNAWAPIVTVITFNLAYMTVGVVVVEAVFVYPGIGQLMVDAVSTRDIPVVQACALIFSGVFVILNLVADIVAIATNPRLLHPK